MDTWIQRPAHAPARDQVKVKEQKVANARLIESTMQAASLFLLATVPFAAADIIGDGTRPYASQGACYDPTTHLAITRRLYFPTTASGARTHDSPRHDEPTYMHPFILGPVCAGRYQLGRECLGPGSLRGEKPRLVRKRSRRLRRMLPLRLELRPLTGDSSRWNLQLPRLKRGSLLRCNDALGHLRCGGGGVHGRRWLLLRAKRNVRWLLPLRPWLRSLG